MNLTYKENYWSNLELKLEFIRFPNNIHGLDLSLWNELGYWDDHYRPFSYFDDSHLVSSVCIYTMDMLVQGKRCRVAQISGVGTIPEYRRQGLSFDLTQKAIDWACDNHDFFYLFADDEAHRFYEKCGFKQVDEYKTSVSVTGRVALPGTVKLSTDQKDQLDLICKVACNREFISDVFGVANNKLFMFWCLYSLGNYINYIPDLDVLVLYKREHGLLTVFDIVGTKIPTFSKLYPYISDENDKTVEFLFMADKLKLDNANLVKIDDNNAFVLGDFPFKNIQFTFPFTSHA